MTQSRRRASCSAVHRTTGPELPNALPGALSIAPPIALPTALPTAPTLR